MYTNCILVSCSLHFCCLPSSDCSSPLRRKKKKKAEQSRNKDQQTRNYGSLGSHSHPCSTSPNKNTHRAACEWPPGTNRVNPKHLLPIQMRICKEVAVFSTSCTACNSQCCNERAVLKDVLTPLLPSLLLLFSIGAHPILLT